MNEYTRREEVRWTFIAATSLVVCIAVAIALLLTAKGPLVPDAAAQTAAVAADARAAQLRPCSIAAEKLATEIDVFKASAKAARLKAETDAGAPPPPRRHRWTKPEKAPDVELAWPAAQPSHKQAKALAPCRASVDGVLGARPDDAAAWNAVAAAAEVEAPADSDTKAQIAAASKLLTILGEVPIERLESATKDAEAAAKKAAEAEHAKAEKTFVRKPLPKGALSREAAVGVGVGLALIALLVSFLSVRVASMRRFTTLAPLREVAKTAHRGLQAAAILKLAAQHNGGEPGLVMGAALGGLFAAFLRPLDSDVFVIGVMGGLPLGLGVQWAYRIATGASKWRARAKELGDLEKPAIPIVLVLSGVNPGLEAQFIKFFGALGPQDAAQTVEKLAAQAEEKILAAAEAGAAAAYAAGAMPGMPPGGMGPGGMPPGGMPPPGGYPR